MMMTIMTIIIIKQPLSSDCTYIIRILSQGSQTKDIK